jgi:hypothetical protein
MHQMEFRRFKGHAGNRHAFPIAAETTWPIISAHNAMVKNKSRKESGPRSLSGSGRSTFHRRPCQ